MQHGYNRFDLKTSVPLAALAPHDPPCECNEFVLRFITLRHMEVAKFLHHPTSYAKHDTTQQDGETYVNIFSATVLQIGCVCLAWS